MSPPPGPDGAAALATLGRALGGSLGPAAGPVSGATLTWLALGLALLLAPAPSAALVRARVLAERGRLVAPPEQRVERIAGTRHAPVAAAALCCAVVTGAVGISCGVVLGCAAAVASATLARLVLAAIRARVARRQDSDLLAALRLIVAELEAGALPGTALAAAAEVGARHRDAFTAAATACRRGEEPQFAADDLSGLGHAWRVAAETGAAPAVVVGRTADDLAGRLAQRREVTAAVAGARSSATMLAGLPVLGALLGTAMQADPLHVLSSTPGGRLLCLVGVALDALGLLWTQALTARAERT